ncbi:GSCOCG00006803001-RA-CDS [Cotesia congregata]|uniref:S-adenosylmethionine sensor upstream of mTORC1 n=1 Tax=Cotesia congregata TaxID=51543 RepID=A0A8J2HMB6_COTCN|nr:GSCOCG00006803001-RA-CDS [Cotesia congregata]CAG5103513.1 Similar to Samtor: S-adenosylmethionine sensor upstream of mTORC1 (Drosophila melanogaster) [Cotesia congregata]
MASEEHKKLAALIKETHNRLREDYRKYGSNEAWKRHLARTDDLQNYAVSMQQLATNHWSINNNIKQVTDKSNCRIRWIKNRCYEYFFGGGKSKYYERERDIIKKLNLDDLNDLPEESLSKDNKVVNERKIKMLDVGSCYNPFADDENLDVTAIDLVPASDQVFQCDFLNVNLGDETLLSKDNKSVIEFEKKSFDVCIFSLLLEYFPCPEQRFRCCEKAYELLKDSGLLIIITPDSKHVNANAKIMKSWRYVLANLGFMRITYEKLQHIHCICYRRCVKKDTAVRWVTLQKNLSVDDVLFNSNGKIFIPQDFQTVCVEDKDKASNVKVAKEDLADVFNELPDVIDK